MKRKIKIRTLEGIIDCSAWIEGPFGVHQEAIAGGLFSLNFSVTHLPSGIAMGPLFENPEDARSFARAIAPLRDWATFKPSDITQRLRAQVKRAYETFNGFKPEGRDDKTLRERAIKEFASDLNGSVIGEPEAS